MCREAVTRERPREVPLPETPEWFRARELNRIAEIQRLALVSRSRESAWRIQSQKRSIIGDFLNNMLKRNIAHKYGVDAATVRRIVEEGTTEEQRNTVRRWHTARRERKRKGWKQRMMVKA